MLNDNKSYVLQVGNTRIYICAVNLQGNEWETMQYTDKVIEFVCRLYGVKCIYNPGLVTLDDPEW